MLMIGDAMLTALDTDRHISLWTEPFCQRPMDWLKTHPNATRLLGVGGLVFGVWLASQQRRPAPKTRLGRLRDALLHA